MATKYTGVVIILVLGIYFYFDQKKSQNNKFNSENIIKLQSFNTNSVQKQSSSSLNDKVIVKNNLHKSTPHIFKKSTSREVSSVPNVLVYISSLKLEEVLIAEAEIFEKIEWSHVKETTDSQNRKIKKIELENGDIANQVLEERMMSLDESLIQEREGRVLSRSSFNDGKSKFISFSKKETSGEEHSVAYKDGILYSTHHYVQDYYYSMSYETDGQISKCTRQKITRPSKNKMQFGEIEDC